MCKKNETGKENNCNCEISLEEVCGGAVPEIGEQIKKKAVTGEIIFDQPEPSPVR